jgi:hypothetical protein
LYEIKGKWKNKIEKLVQKEEDEILKVEGRARFGRVHEGPNGGKVRFYSFFNVIARWQ